MRRYYFLLMLLALGLMDIKAQVIELKCTNKPLNELLTDWRDHYQLEFSFDDHHLSQYRVTMHQRFPSPAEAVEAVLKDFPLSYKKRGEVFIVFRTPIPNTRPQVIIAKVVDTGTGEPLPFSHVSLNARQCISDEKGVFMVELASDSGYHLKVSHLGYYILDTLYAAGVPEVITLSSSQVGLPEVRITNDIVETATQVGEQAGLVSLNHHIAEYLPGHADNSVFNLLKLQAGINASGETPDHLMLWGSSEGTSVVNFDGFTIWGLKNLNDNISSVNPFMVKSVDIYKGAYDASQNDYVGGIVNITGINGNRYKPAFRLFLNNQTMNSMLELPLGKKSSVVATYRQNYYDLLSSSDIELREIKTIEDNDWDYRDPDYQFRDLNLKYSFQSDNGDMFFMSLLAGGDQLDFRGLNDSTLVRPNRDVQMTEHLHVKEDTRQLGSTLYYGKTFRSGLTSALQISYSGYENNYTINTYREFTNVTTQRYNRKATNTIDEVKGEWQNQWLLKGDNRLRLGIGMVQNNTRLKEEIRTVQYINLRSHATRLILYARHELWLRPAIRLNTGLRLNYATHLATPYLDPRIALSYRPSPTIKINGAWGRYHQFISQTSVINDNNRVRYAWFVSGYNEVPVLKSNHYVLSSSYTPRGFLLSVEAYYKSNANLTRFINDNPYNRIANGESYNYGIDICAKKDINGHTLWASYSLARSEEWFDYFNSSAFQRAPQDQRHEFKIAGLYNLSPLHFSASYVYGSGFPVFAENTAYADHPYHRVDIGMVYRIAKKWFTAEAGASLLNVFNHKNIKYNSFQVVPVDEFNTLLVNQDAVPFSPLLHLKIEF